MAIPPVPSNPSARLRLAREGASHASPVEPRCLLPAATNGYHPGSCKSRRIRSSMTTLQIEIPDSLLERIHDQARAGRRSVGAEVVQLLEEAVQARQTGHSRSLARILSRAHVPPPGTPDSVELLREDR